MEYCRFRSWHVRYAFVRTVQQLLYLQLLFFFDLLIEKWRLIIVVSSNLLQDSNGQECVWFVSRTQSERRRCWGIHCYNMSYLRILVKKERNLPCRSAFINGKPIVLCTNDYYFLCVVRNTRQLPRCSTKALATALLSIGSSLKTLVGYTNNIFSHRLYYIMLG